MSRARGVKLASGTGEALADVGSARLERSRRVAAAPAAAKAMVVAGVMSGTSADGVDVSLVRVSQGVLLPPRASASLPKTLGAETSLPRVKLLGHAAFPFARKLREAVLAAMDGRSTSPAELAQMHWRLGEVYGDAVVEAQRRIGRRASLVGVHGQTVYHQSVAAPYLGKPLRCTWQMGEASEVSLRTGLPVVSDFRPADMVMGGEGAPLVPVFDRVFFSHERRNRVLQNLGGIANMTAIPAGSAEVLAFDSGPANVLMDVCMRRLYGRGYDRGGAVAGRGHAVTAVVEAMLRMPYFAAAPPKSCGREQFGEALADRLIAECRAAGATDADVVATATALTAESVLEAYRRFVWPFLGQRAPLAEATEYVVAGGGAKNETLMRRLRDGLEPLGVRVRRAEEFAVPAEAKESMAFALLAWLRWHGMPGNVPSATGASRAVPLGRVTLP